MAHLTPYREGAGLLQVGQDIYTVANLLAANIPESLTVPTGEDGLLAKYVSFSKTGDFYAKCFTSAEDDDRVEGGNLTSYVTNGAFASDTGWTKGTGWTIAGGLGTATGAISTALSQTSASALVQGQSYTVTFTLDQTAGSVTVSLGGTNGTARSTDATFSEVIVAGASQIIAFTGSGFTGTIDNVIITPWVYGVGWADGSSTATATTATSDLSQTARTTTPLKNGHAYYVTFTATRSAGSVAVSLGGGTAGTSRSSAATFSEIIIAGSTQAITFTGTGFSGTIDDVIVLPVASVPGDSTTGNASELNPAGYFLNGNIASISIVSAGTPIVTTNFYK